MTTPSPSGGPSVLRVGGLALIGVAIVAAILGVTTLATGGGNGQPNAAAPSSPPVAAEPAPTTGVSPESPSPTGDGDVPVPSFEAGAPGGAAAPTAPGAPPATAAPTGAPAPGPAPGAKGGESAAGGDRVVSAVQAPLRVYNNSTIKGLANRAAGDFRNAGWPVTEVGNYAQGIIPTSTVYYRQGTNEQAPAQALADQFGLRVEPRFEGLRNANPGLIVIVTNDYGP